MLCNEIMDKGITGITCDMRAMIERIKVAQKFVLAQDFAATADSFSTDFDALVRVMSWCRLPYANTWIEVSQAHRPSFMAANIHAPLFQTRPYRVGFLCTAKNTALSAWDAHLFWSVPSGNSAAGMKIDFDMVDTIRMPAECDDMKDEPAQFNTPFVQVNETHPGWLKSNMSVREAMVAHTCPSTADYGIEAMPPGIHRSTWLNLLHDLARADWAGEISYLLAVIALLNARNVVEYEQVDKTEHNRIRAKRGQAPLANHTIIKISRRLQTMMKAGPGAKNENLPAHMVRGHFKRRRTGIFFWHPHMRGTKGEPTSKTYVLA